MSRTCMYLALWHIHCTQSACDLCLPLGIQWLLIKSIKILVVSFHQFKEMGGQEFFFFFFQIPPMPDMGDSQLQLWLSCFLFSMRVFGFDIMENIMCYEILWHQVCQQPSSGSVWVGEEVSSIGPTQAGFIRNHWARIRSVIPLIFIVHHNRGPDLACWLCPNYCNPMAQYPVIKPPPNSADTAKSAP